MDVPLLNKVVVNCDWEMPPERRELGFVYAIVLLVVFYRRVIEELTVGPELRWDAIEHRAESDGEVG